MKRKPGILGRLATRGAVLAATVCLLASRGQGADSPAENGSGLNQVRTSPSPQGTPSLAPRVATNARTAGSGSPAPFLLTNLDAALDLSLEASQRGHRIKALATVTYSHPQWRMMFVQGAALGTFLKISPDTPSFRPGDVVEIEGSATSANGYAEIKAESVKPTGRRQVPRLQSWTMEEILSGRASGQWAALEGRVLAAYGREGRLFIQTAVGATNCAAFLLNWRPEQARQMLDARVRITGVVSVQFDGQGRRIGVALLAQEPEQVQVLEPAAANPFSLPLTPIAQLTVSKDGAPRRTHVRGGLERAEGGSVAAVRDRTGVVQVSCLYKLDLPSDAGVEVFGYPSLAHGELVLKDAIVLPLGSTGTPGNNALPEVSLAPTSLSLLETAQAVHQLDRGEAARGHPVRLEAVVTFSDAAWWSLFVQDASGGVFVTPSSSGLDLRPGQKVRVQGVTAAGDFAPIVIKATFEALGEAPMPDPIRVGLDALLTGQLDSRWVEIRGLVQSVVQEDQRSWLYLVTAQGQLQVLLGPTIPIAEAEKLVNARVTLRGVAGGEFNASGQIVAARLHVPNAHAIQVDDPAPTDPFSTPLRAIGDLSRYQSDQDVPRRVRVAGRVTSVAEDQTISLQDGSGGMLVRLAHRDRMPRLGEQVEIVGFPFSGDFSTTLKNAWSRLAGSGQEPAALVVTPEQVLTNEPNATLVKIQARLVQDAWLRPAQTLMLRGGSVVFEAVLPGDPKGVSWEHLDAGTRLEVTGVCLIDGGRWGQAKSFHLRLRQSGDLKILSRPPWWNLRRLLWSLAGTGALGALAVALNLLLAQKNRLLRTHILERARAETELQGAHAALRRANETLEQRVAERTRELREQVAAKEKAHAELAAAQKDLVEASRLAGMAEVATGVLHNVGNVVNSINVSSTLIREQLRRSEFSSLRRLKGLLEQHEVDMASFLSTDPKGKLVPVFIIQLADCLDRELATLQSEHEQLASNVKHVKEIVSMQQSYARVSGTLEQLPISSLVDDALRMNAAALDRQDVEVIREYSDVPPLMVDKNKVLQILVNLIQNARHALDASRNHGKQLKIGVNLNGEGRVKISVTDNGIGVSPENLPRLFSHGFTTKKGGHGFGLHSGANAAKEMGGQLTAYSEGVDQGATFTLELPLDHRRTP